MLFAVSWKTGFGLSFGWEEGFLVHRGEAGVHVSGGISRDDYCSLSLEINLQSPPSPKHFYFKALVKLKT